MVDKEVRFMGSTAVVFSSLGVKVGEVYGVRTGARLPLGIDSCEASGSRVGVRFIFINHNCACYNICCVIYNVLQVSCLNLVFYSRV